MANILTQEAITNLGLTSAQIELILDAGKIFERFLEDGAEQWVCIEVKYIEEIREKLREKVDIDITLFDKAQSQIYATMQSVCYFFTLLFLKINLL